MLVLLLGGFIRLKQWLGNRSLWYDELLVADSVLGRGHLRLLTEPLAHDQSAPPLWLTAEKLAVQLFGPDERALRLPSLLAGLATVGLVWLVARRVLPPVLAPVAMTLVAFSPVLLRFSNELKQYAFDGAAVLLVLLLALRVPRHDPPGRALVLLAGFGCVVVWASTASVFALSGVSVLIVLEQWRYRGLRAACGVALVLSAWLVSLAVEYVLVLQASQQSAFLQEYWASSFPGEDGLLAWAGRRVLAVAAGPLSLRATLPLAYVVLGLGLLLLLLRGGRGGRAVVLTLLSGFTAAGLSLYPLGQRVALWTIPLAALVLTAVLPGRLRADDHVQHPRRQTTLRTVWLVVAAVALLELVQVSAASARRAAQVVLTLEELRPLMAEVQGLRRPGDAVVVEQGAEVGTRLYADQTGLRRDGVVRLTPGSCDDREALDAVGLGRRPVWLIVSHVSSGTTRAGGVGALLQRMSTQARVVRHLEHWQGSDAYLFEPGAAAAAAGSGRRACFVRSGS